MPERFFILRRVGPLTSMAPTILLPIDADGGTDAANAHAMKLTKTLGGSMHVLSVVDVGGELATIDREPRDELRVSLKARVEESMGAIEEQASERGIEVTRSIADGTPFRRIVAYAEDHDVDLIVMGTRARSSPTGVGLGSTTERVILLSTTPVLAVPVDEDITSQPEYDRVIIATDGSDASERAADHGIGLLEPYAPEISAIYVIDTSTYEFEDAARSIVGLLKEGGKRAIDRIAASGRDRGLDVTTAIRRGDPHDELVTFTDEVDGDLIIMGVSGRSGAGDRFLGSTTARVLRRSSRPVMTIR